MRTPAIIAIVLLTGACASQQKPAEPTPTGAPVPAGSPTPAAQPPQASQPVTTYDQLMEEDAAGRASYLKMSLAAAGFVRHIAPGKMIGFYQSDLASTSFQEMVEEVTKTYAFRPIRNLDFRVVCDNPGSNSGSVTKATPTCTMALADAIVQFNSTRMSLDSGFVGGSVTQVPRGWTQPEQKAFCITLVHRGDAWIALRSETVQDGRRCPR